MSPSPVEEPEADFHLFRVRRGAASVYCPVAEICRHYSADPSRLTALPSLAVHHWYDLLRRLVSRAPRRPNWVNLSLRRDTSFEGQPEGRLIVQSRILLTGPFCSPSIYMFKVLCLVLIGLLGRAEAREIVGRNATAGKLVLEVP